MFDISKIISTFEILTNSEADKYLQEGLGHKGETGELFVVAGPNGSGKSTLIANMFKNNQLSSHKYVNADIFAKTMFKDVLSDKERNMQAMYYTMGLFKELAKTNQAVIYETVLSHPSKLELIELYKKQGYKVVSVFISPKDFKVNIQRVAKRVQEGGHDVPEDKIEKRFKRSHSLKEALEKLSDEYYEIDNTILPKIVYQKNNCVEKM